MPDDERAVEQLILGGPRRYTWDQLVLKSEIPQHLAGQLWRSMGFAEVAPDEVAFTDTDRDALQQLNEARNSGLAPIDVQLAAMRPIGQAMAGLADWQVDTLRQLLPPPARADRQRQRYAGEALLELLDNTQHYVWRRHLATAAGRVAAANPAYEHTRTLAVGFADIVGFTRATRQLPPTDLLELVDRFHQIAAELVTIHHGRVVKTVGDEALFIVDSPAEAAEIALELRERVAASSRLPTLRIGLAFGPVLTRFGDVYGEVVNIAARLTSSADPGRILIDAPMAHALDDHVAYRVRRHPPLQVRGYDNLGCWSLAHDTTAAP